jgi:hypothetical protein
MIALLAYVKRIGNSFPRDMVTSWLGLEGMGQGNKVQGEGLWCCGVYVRVCVCCAGWWPGCELVSVGCGCGNGGKQKTGHVG